ncbi:CCAAT/enhancer-binding protein zeta-like isoform X2 [Stylophora pistillata]|uniref:CCAAT/enhancer-binding protein zeta-like isoform X2 n=1 Tax=Stylophora pistillata TaxID=50429 RepID=UPI000C055EF2|nr:CCAAT/enhancer-binding protein zeta-like isoform X2 [Stylophora pistillata]
MADKVAKNAKRKKKRKPKDSHGFSLEDVLAVGGDKDDFEMLKDVDISDDFYADEETSGIVEEKEIMSLIRELGLDKVTFKGEKLDELDILQDETADTGLKSGESLQKDVEGKDAKKEKKNKRKESEVTNLSKSTGSTVTAQVPQVLPERKGGPRQKLLIQSGGLWYDLVVEDNTSSPSGSADDVMRLSKEAADLFEQEVGIYDKMKAKEKSSDSQWLKSVVSSGTLNDKVAALTVQVQESAVHCLKTLDILIGMAKKKGRRESIIAVDMLKELWMTLLLPNNRKLRKFSQHPLLSLVEIVHKGGGWDERDKRLILWYFEEQLKQRYQEFVEVVQKLLQDTLVNIRSKMLGAVFDLLSEKPEQEQVLLSLLINKIGDPDRKIASKAVYLSRTLVTKHPNMKLVVTKEIEKLLYRPNIAIKAQYFAVCFLNQLILTKQDSELATRLISIYFSFFRAFLTKGELEAKMLSALLTGVNRAFPYAKEEDDQYNEQINTLFRTVHIGTFNTSVQALMLLYQVMESRQSVSDRFYSALYAKLLDPNLKTSSKQAVFLNILYKSVKSDPSLHRVKAFVKRIIQVCSFQQPSFVCGALFMISELTKLKPGIKSLTQQPEEEDDEEHFVDVPSEDDEDEISTEEPSSAGEEPQISHVDAAKASRIETHVSGPQKSQTYKPSQRNPLYSGAENSCLWELNRLSRHYHPSVSHFAHTLMKGDNIEYKGDPLQDFTLMRFLDRFVYKNPKQKERDHGGSLMQPKTSSSRLAEEPVNTKAFLAKKEEDIREDELFFHRYFKRKAEKESQRKKKAGESDDEISEKETNFDNVPEERSSFEYDFASDLKSSKTSTASRNKQIASDEEDEGDDEKSEEGESEDEELEEKEFDYDGMDFSSSEDEQAEEPATSQGKKRKFTEKDYEKALLENLSSDEFSEDEGSQITKKKSKKGNTTGGDVSSMFASAEEFAHLLENSKASRGGSYDVKRRGASDKQLKWEENKTANNCIKTTGNRGRGEGGRKGPRRKSNFNPRTKFRSKGRGAKRSR